MVGTPIGNLSDVSSRVLVILGSCDYIACEDSRVAAKLFLLLKIEKKNGFIGYRDENEVEQAQKIVDLLKAGKSVAIVSDAGLPGISDPGFRVVRECRRNGMRVVPVSGPCALTLGLIASGLPTNSFLYVGFLPPRSGARQTFFQKYFDFEHTIILYESVHRIEKALDDMLAIYGPDRVIAIAKEITKQYETFLVGSVRDVGEKLKRTAIKGEFVIVIAPKDFRL